MEDDGVNLLKHYQQYRPANIHIPANSFKMYLKVYNEALQEQELKR